MNEYQNICLGNAKINKTTKIYLKKYKSKACYKNDLP